MIVIVAVKPAVLLAVLYPFALPDMFLHPPGFVSQILCQLLQVDFHFLPTGIVFTGVQVFCQHLSFLLHGIIQALVIFQKYDDFG